MNYQQLAILLVSCYLVTAQIIYEENGEEYEAPCLEDEDCIKYGDINLVECRDESSCYCKEDSTYNTQLEKCILVKTILNAAPPPGPVKNCTTDNDCKKKIADSNCINYNCVCPKDFTLSNNKSKCLPLAKQLGWGCEEDIQCTTYLNKTTTCNKDSLTCTCKPGLEVKDNACVELKELDAFCTTSIVCKVPESECNQGICACRIGFLPSPDNKKCLEESQGYKAPCEENIQCTGPFGPEAVCVNKQCICRPDHHFAEMRCWKDKGLTGQCESDVECYIKEDGSNQRLECVSGQCSCKDDYEPDLNDMKCTGGAASIQATLFSALLLFLIKLLS